MRVSEKPMAERRNGPLKELTGKETPLKKSAGGNGSLKERYEKGKMPQKKERERKKRMKEDHKNKSKR